MLNPGAVAKPKEAIPVIRLIEPMVTPTSRCAVVTISSLGRLTMGTVHLPARLPTVTLPRSKSRVTETVSSVGENMPFSYALVWPLHSRLIGAASAGPTLSAAEKNTTHLIVPSQQLV